MIYCTQYSAILCIQEHLWRIRHDIRRTHQDTIAIFYFLCRQSVSQPMIEFTAQNLSTSTLSYRINHLHHCYPILLKTSFSVKKKQRKHGERRLYRFVSAIFDSGWHACDVSRKLLDMSATAVNSVLLRRIEFDLQEPICRDWFFEIKCIEQSDWKRLQLAEDLKYWPSSLPHTISNCALFFLDQT